MAREDFAISTVRQDREMTPALLNSYKELCTQIFVKADVWPKKVTLLPKKQVGHPQRQGLAGARVLSTAPNLIHLAVQPNGNDTCRELRVVPPDGSDITDFKKRIEEVLKGPKPRSLDEIALEMQTQEHALAALDLIIEQMRDVSIVSGLGKSIVELRVPSFVGVLTDDEMSALIELLTECGAVRLKTCRKKPGQPCWHINSEVLLDLHEKLSRLEKAPEVVDEDEDDTADVFGDVMYPDDDDAPVETAPEQTTNAPDNSEEQEKEPEMNTVPEQSLESLTSAIVLRRAELSQIEAQIQKLEQQRLQIAEDIAGKQVSALRLLEKFSREIKGE